MTDLRMWELPSSTTSTVRSIILAQLTGQARSPCCFFQPHSYSHHYSFSPR